jgi:cell fate regulator YaaT (PSP1 superfamily)
MLQEFGPHADLRPAGALGPCSAAFYSSCHTWLQGLHKVSIRMACNQGLVLNLNISSGPCGQFKHCLLFEHDVYQFLPERRSMLKKRSTGNLGSESSAEGEGLE